MRDINAIKRTVLTLGKMGIWGYSGVSLYKHLTATKPQEATKLELAKNTALLILHAGELKHAVTQTPVPALKAALLVALTLHSAKETYETAVKLKQ